MQHLISQLEEAVGGGKSNLDQMMTEFVRGFMADVATTVSASLKGGGTGARKAYVETDGFDWPVVMVTQDDEPIYDLELTLDTLNNDVTLAVNQWEGPMQKGDKTKKMKMGQVTAAVAADFMIEYIMRRRRR